MSSPRRPTQQQLRKSAGPSSAAAGPSTLPRRSRVSMPADSSRDESDTSGLHRRPSEDRSAGAQQRRRSHSQPPPAETLIPRQQAQQSVMAMQAQLRGAATPSRTPASSRKLSQQSQSQQARRSRAALETPRSIVADRSISMAIMRSARRSASRRKNPAAGWAGWGGARDESPMDLLRRLARAPAAGNFARPSFPSGDVPPQIRSVPIGESRLSTSRLSTSFVAGEDPTGSGTTASQMDGSQISSGFGSFPGSSGLGGRESGASASGSGSRSSMLRPGQSVPGDLTRDGGEEGDFGAYDEDDDSMMERSMDVDGSATGSVGLGRRQAVAGTSVAPRSNIFAAILDERDKRSRLSRGSRLTADMSGVSSRRSDFSAADASGLGMASRSRIFGDDGREAELEKTLDPDGTGVGATTRDRTLEDLNELTRRSFFGASGMLSVGGEPDDEGGFGGEPSFTSNRAMSEPLAEMTTEPFFDDAGAGEMPSDFELSREDAMAVMRDLSMDLANSSARDTSLRQEEDVKEATPDNEEEEEDYEPPPQLDERDATTLTEQEEEQERQAEMARMEEELRALEEAERAEEQGEESDSDLASASGSEVEGQEAPEGAAYLALMRKKSTRKRKERISAYTGSVVPLMPTSLVNSLFTTFALPSTSGGAGGTGRKQKIKIERAALEAVEDSTHDFLGRLSQELSKQAARSGRTSTINESDVVAVLRAQGAVSSRSPLTTLARRLLPRELSDLITTADKLQTSVPAAAAAPPPPPASAPRRQAESVSPRKRAPAAAAAPSQPPRQKAAPKSKASAATTSAKRSKGASNLASTSGVSAATSSAAGGAKPKVKGSVVMRGAAAGAKRLALQGAGQQGAATAGKRPRTS